MIKYDSIFFYLQPKNTGLFICMSHCWTVQELLFCSLVYWHNSHWHWVTCWHRAHIFQIILLRLPHWINCLTVENTKPGLIYPRQVLKHEIQTIQTSNYLLLDGMKWCVCVCVCVYLPITYFEQIQIPLFSKFVPPVPGAKL